MVESKYTQLWTPHRNEQGMSHSDLSITFVHTPMPIVQVPEKQGFWRGFDRRYASVHPNLKPMKDPVLWELPHWMPWLGGVLTDQGYTNINVTNFYGDEQIMSVGEPMQVDHKKVTDTLRKEGPREVYLFSPMESNLHCAVDIADAIKELYPDSKVIFGGVVATPLHKEVAKHPSVDYVVRDAGEVALPALLNAIEGRVPLDQVGNISYKKPDGEVTTNVQMYPELVPQDIPFPQVDLFTPQTGDSLRYIRQVHELGCRAKCAFCTIRTIGRDPQLFPVKRNMQEIDAYRSRYGEHHTIYWGDETFIPGKSGPLLDALTERGDVVSDIQTRVGVLTDPAQLRKLRDAGVRWVEIGLETSNPEDRRRQKGAMQDATPEMPVEDILRQIRDHGLAACAFTINGIPGQTPDQMRRNIDWVAGLIDADLLQATYFNNAVPYLGSSWSRNPASFGIELIDKRVHPLDYSRSHEDLPSVFKTQQAPDPERVYEIFREGTKTLGEVMDKPPYFGEPNSRQLAASSDIWKSPHV